MTKNEPHADTANRDLVITRTFHAPRELVFKAWSDPEMVKHWWGPKNFTAPFVQMDFRVGGTYLFCMRSREGEDFWSTGTFREIVPPERIVYTDSFADEKGNKVPASYYKMTGEWPLEMVVTLTFEELEAGKTKFTLRHAGIPAGQMSDMTNAGWNESLDKLEAAVASVK